MSADEVIQKAVARAQRAPARFGPKGYTYTKLTVTEELDATGKIKERKERVYEVLFRSGETYLKLLQINGRPTGDTEMKNQSENQLKLGQLLGQPKAGKGDNRENFLTPDLVARFDFTLAGQSSLNGRPTYQIAFRPRTPEPSVHHILDRLLNRISGTLWIDAQEFEIAQADIQLRSEVDLLWGVAGSLKKMAFTLVRTRVADGVWFNTSSKGDFEGRKLLDSTRIKTRSRSTNFRPLA